MMEGRTMKRFNLFVSALLLAVSMVSAASVRASSFWTAEQVAQSGDVESTVKTVLAGLPAEKQADFDALMQLLASTGEEGILALAEMLPPTGEEQIPAVEYALNGVVAYVSAEGREELAAPIRAGLRTAIEKCTDKTNQAFLMSQLQLIGTSADSDFFVKYIDDEYLETFAASALMSIQGADDVLLSLIKKSSPSSALANAAAFKSLQGAEKYLLKWAAASTDEVIKENVYNALRVCGSSKSISVLSEAAKADSYGLGTTDATGAYLGLVNRLAAAGDSKGLAEAETLLASDYTHIRIAGLEILLNACPDRREALVLEALDDTDREYRVAALTAASGFGGGAREEVPVSPASGDDAAAVPEICASVVAAMPSLSIEAQTDVVNWLGDCRAADYCAAVVEAMSSSDPQLAVSAIRAAGKIGGEDALNALVAALDGPFGKDAVTALAHFNGDIRPAVIEILDGSSSAPATAAAVKLAGQRHIKSAAPKTLELTGSDDTMVRSAAYDALAGVCSPEDFGSVCSLLDDCADEYVAPAQAAALSALADTEPSGRYDLTSARMEASAHPERYYPLLASTGSPDAVATLLEAARGGSNEAFTSLLKIDDPQALVSPLIELAGQNDGWKDAAAKRVCTLIKKYEPAEDRVARLADALAASPSAKVCNNILETIGESYDLAGIPVALQYIDDSETAEGAAYAIKSVCAKNVTAVQSDEAVRDALNKAKAVFAVLAQNSADAGYAVDEINLLLEQ